MPNLTFNPKTDYYNYNRADWRGQKHYSCLDCAYDVLNDEDHMIQHCSYTGHGIERKGKMAPEDFIWSELKLNGGLGSHVTLGLLSWNTCGATSDSIWGLIKERHMLRILGCAVRIIIVDNGSTDGTVAMFNNLSPGLKLDIYRNSVNRGISKARNLIIDQALKWGSESILFLDSDIQPVPVSTYCMIRYLRCHPKVGCIGAYSSNCTSEEGKEASHLYEIQQSRVRSDIACAWTQYGMFRAEMFKEGIRFDEAGPFGKPGWGYEDDDLYLQMSRAGWDNHYFGGMCYLHRNLRSSHVNLVKDGLSPRDLFEQRKEHLVRKWTALGLHPSKLLSVQAQTFPEA